MMGLAVTRGRAAQHRRWADHEWGAVRGEGAGEMSQVGIFSFVNWACFRLISTHAALGVQLFAKMNDHPAPLRAACGRHHQRAKRGLAEINNQRAVIGQPRRRRRHFDLLQRFPCNCESIMRTHW